MKAKHRDAILRGLAKSIFARRFLRSLFTKPDWRETTISMTKGMLDVLEQGETR